MMPPGGTGGGESEYLMSAETLTNAGDGHATGTEVFYLVERVKRSTALGRVAKPRPHQYRRDDAGQQFGDARRPDDDPSSAAAPVYYPSQTGRNQYTFTCVGMQHDEELSTTMLRSAYEVVDGIDYSTTGFVRMHVIGFAGVYRKLHIRGYVEPHWLTVPMDLVNEIAEISEDDFNEQYETEAVGIGSYYEHMV